MRAASGRWFDAMAEAEYGFQSKAQNMVVEVRSGSRDLPGRIRGRSLSLAMTAVKARCFPSVTRGHDSITLLIAVIKALGRAGF